MWYFYLLIYIVFLLHQRWWSYRNVDTHRHLRFIKVEINLLNGLRKWTVFFLSLWNRLKESSAHSGINWSCERPSCFQLQFHRLLFSSSSIFLSFARSNTKYHITLWTSANFFLNNGTKFITPRSKELHEIESVVYVLGMLSQKYMLLVVQSIKCATYFKLFFGIYLFLMKNMFNGRFTYFIISGFFYWNKIYYYNNVGWQWLLMYGIF